MNNHLRTLAGRDYAGAITQCYKQSGRAGSLGCVFNVMYLPSESAIEKLRRADPGFDEKTERHAIILAGPTSLAGLFSLAKMQIAARRQSENSERIVEAAEGLMESVVTALGHVDKVGNSIRTAADAFDKFGKSVNRYVIPRLRNLQRLGVAPAKQKEIPGPLATYDIRKIEETIDVEIEIIEEKQKLINA
ncbi:MAG: DNA recombination protein RmuC [Rickettsiales bacterium]